jgi:hypothetical protein
MKAEAVIWNYQIYKDSQLLQFDKYLEENEKSGRWME